MEHQGSYRAETFAVGLDQEIRRLNAQVDLFWRSEQAALQRAGLEDGMDLLDCGCGPGRLIELLKTEHPSLRVTGLEIDPTLVTAAKEQMTRAGFDDWSIVQASAESPNLAPESFDFIVMRLVLEHLVDPVLALRELKKLLRPGGRIAIISNDFEFHLRTWPPVPELDDLYDAYIASRRADGGDPCIGRRVPGLLREAGFRIAGYEVENAHNLLEGDPAFLLAEGAGIPAKLVESGYLPEEVFARLVTSWRAMLEHPDHMMVRPLFIAVGENSDQTSETAADESPAAETMTRATNEIKELDYIAPSTDTEREIAGVWAEVIGLERVGVNQNFFDLGGTSLMLEHVQVRLEATLDRQLPLTTLFQHPTVGSLAASLEEPAQTKSSTPQAASSDEQPTSQLQDNSEAVSRRAQRRRDAMLRRPSDD